MKERYYLKVFAGVMVLALAVIACSIPGMQANEPADQGPVRMENPPMPGPQEPIPPTGQEPPPPPPPPGNEPPPGQEPPPPEVQHMDIPTSWTGNESTIHDQETKNYASEKRAYSGDTFIDNRLERPFNQDMTYLPWLDLINVNLVRDEPFMYFSLVVQERSFSSEGEPPIFGCEIDTDIDGRGDLLVQTVIPLETEWGQEGISVWEDSNENVGGETPVNSDGGAGGGDGYERGVFEAGHGDDPDLAWSRLNPEDAARIDIAFHSNYLPDDQILLWGCFADGFPGGPESFDLNDRFSLEEAGSAMKESDYYPLKAFFAFDNTCRTASGFTPEGYEPGICPNIVPPAPERVPEKNVVCGWVMRRWVCQ